MTIDAAMCLAAGFGTRMRPLTDHRPKPLLHVAGRSMLDRALDHVEGAGLARAVVNLHYLGGMIRTHLEARAVPEIRFSKEAEILDTGGGVAWALPLLGPQPFVVMNADTIWAGPNPLIDLLAAWRPGEMSALLLLVPRATARAYTRPGDFTLEGGRPARRGAAPTAPYVYSGAQILAPEALDSAPTGPFSMNIIWDRLLARDQLRAVVYRGIWVDVGTPAGLDEAEAALTE